MKTAWKTNQIERRMVQPSHTTVRAVFRIRRFQSTKRLLPLLVDDCPYPSLDPLPEVLQPFLHVREQEVVYPAREQPRDVFAHFLGRGRVISFGEQADSGLQRGEKKTTGGQPGRFLYGCCCIVRINEFVQSWMIRFSRPQMLSSSKSDRPQLDKTTYPRQNRVIAAFLFVTLL